jgi:hypothetical protein
LGRRERRQERKSNGKEEGEEGGRYLGLKSARYGTLSLIRWKSSIDRSTPTERAVAIRWSTELVDPVIVKRGGEGGESGEGERREKGEKVGHGVGGSCNVEREEGEVRESGAQSWWIL